MATRPFGCFIRRVTCGPSASLFLLVIGCATAAGQAVPAERSEGVLKPGEKVASSASPTMLEGFLKTQASELLSRHRREVASTKNPEQIAQRPLSVLRPGEGRHRGDRPRTADGAVDHGPQLS